MKLLLIVFIIFNFNNLHAEDTVPSGDAEQATVRHHSVYVSEDGTGNVGAACPFTNTSCVGLDCESCGGCLTPENSKQISDKSQREQ